LGVSWGCQESRSPASPFALVNPNNVQTDGVIKGVRETARAKSVQLQILKASTEGEINAAFGTLMQMRSGTVICSSHDEHRPRIELYEVPAFSHDKLATRDISALDHAGGWRTNVPIAR